MDSQVLPVIMDNFKLSFKKKLNMWLYSISGILGIFVGITFLPYYLLKSNMYLIALTSLSFIIGVCCIIYLYILTGKLENE